MRFAAVLVFALVFPLGLIPALPVPSAAAQVAVPYSGTRVIDTGQSFNSFLKKLKAAIKANKMGIVAEACADCGARAMGVTIRGNRVIMIYHPRFAIRMLKASVPAGIEAPLRLYVTEETTGARLTYRLPSHVFAPYETPALDAMAGELDGIVAKIVEDALK